MKTLYAAETSVPVGRSQDEIKKILGKYGATAFAFGESVDKAMVQFEMKGKRIKFVMPMPVKHVTKDHRGYLISENTVAQISRSKWRVLLILIKSKLESVNSGVATLEQEFMAHILLPNGQTVGDAVIPEIENSYRSREMPPLLGMR